MEGDQTRPDDVKAFPGIKLGDKLYGCNDLETGVWEVMVVGFDPDGFPLIVSFGAIVGEQVGWATGDYFPTVAEAIADQAKHDVDWHGPRLKLAQEALEAVRTGGDLQKFIDGVEL
ncbi:MAG: hypothetical protein KGL39_28905 [Patescibacteria group bacterium]|nr:hypothetical protein [Patescibacteria group bacterium]